MVKRNIVHVEIPAADSNAAGEFYQKLFGWEIEHMDTFDYTSWAYGKGAGEGGGFTGLSDTNKPGDVIIYINSEDIEADLKKAESLGGRIITPRTEIPQIGWYGVFEDPTGNKIAVYTSMDPDFNK